MRKNDNADVFPAHLWLQQRLSSPEPFRDNYFGMHSARPGIRIFIQIQISIINKMKKLLQLVLWRILAQL